MCVYYVCVYIEYVLVCTPQPIHNHQEHDNAFHVTRVFSHRLTTQVYPCAAVNTIFPWVCIMRGAALFWAAEDLLRSSQRRSWNWIFINEMLRTTAAAAKLILSVLLAWQVGQVCVCGVWCVVVCGCV